MIRKILERLRLANRTAALAHDALIRGARDRDLGLLGAHYRDRAVASTEKYRDPRSLTPRAFKVYSKHDEDGAIEAIFERIGEGSRLFLEIGVENGLESNTTYLLAKGWSGAWIEGSSEHCREIERTFAKTIANGRLRVRNAFVRSGDVLELARSLGVAEDLDLLSVDIDGADYWVWEALAPLRPRVVVVEYNARMGPTLDWKRAKDDEGPWRGGMLFGASLKAFERLGERLGYALVGCTFAGTNAFFVRRDLVADRFLEPFDAAFHFEPPRYAFYSNVVKERPEFDDAQWSGKSDAR